MVSVISLLAVVIDLATLASIRQFRCAGGVLAVNLTVIKHYFIDADERGAGGIFNNIVLPVIGFLLTVYLWFSLSKLTLVVGLIWLGVGLLGCCW